MEHTEVFGKCGISAKVVEDSINPSGNRLTTLQLTYPRFILAEFNTHRVFSRNTASSRAIPVAKMVEQISIRPAMPVYWGKNMAGMQAVEELEEFEKRAAITCWLEAANYAGEMAKRMAALGVHKQITNRLLEPFMITGTVVTSSEWDNFFELRHHKDAQPEFFELADTINLAFDRSVPKELRVGQWHLPYIRDSEKPYLTLLQQIQVSTARCCRVSYMKHDGSKSTLKEDQELHDKLIRSVPRHSSPAEHQATPSGFFRKRFTGTRYSGNLHHSWTQYRKLVELGEVDKNVGWK